MTPSDDLQRLVERIEAADVGSRELDGEIFTALGWSPVPNPTNSMGLLNRWQRAGARTSHEGPPMYTKSIDDAVRLVPDGCQWRLDSHYNMAGVFAYPVDPESGPYCVEYAGESSNAALALCAAALRARINQEQSNEKPV